MCPILRNSVDSHTNGDSHLIASDKRWNDGPSVSVALCSYFWFNCLCVDQSKKKKKHAVSFFYLSESCHTFYDKRDFVLTNGTITQFLPLTFL